MAVCRQYDLIIAPPNDKAETILKEPEAEKEGTLHRPMQNTNRHYKQTGASTNINKHNH